MMSGQDRRKPRGPYDGFMTQREVALALGVTFQAVQQLEKKALKKLAKAMRRRGLTYADLSPSGQIGEADYLEDGPDDRGKHSHRKPACSKP